MMDFYDPESPTEDEVVEKKPASPPLQPQEPSSVLLQPRPNLLDLASVPLPVGKAPPPCPSTAPAPLQSPPPLEPSDEDGEEASEERGRKKKKKKKKKKHRDEERHSVYYEVEASECPSTGPPAPKELAPVSSHLPADPLAPPLAEPSLPVPASTDGQHTEGEEKAEEPQTLAKKLLSKALGNVSKGESTPQTTTEESSSAGETPTSSPMLGKLRFSMKPVMNKVQKVSFTLKPKKNTLKSAEDEEEEDEEGKVQLAEGATPTEPVQPARFNFKKSKGELFLPKEADAAELLNPQQQVLAAHNALALQAMALMQQEKVTASLEAVRKRSPSEEKKGERRGEEKESRRRRNEDEDVRDRRERGDREKRSRDHERRSRRSRQSEEKESKEEKDARSSRKQKEEENKDLEKESKGDKDVNRVMKQNPAEEENIDAASAGDNTSLPKSQGLSEISVLYKDVIDDSDEGKLAQKLKENSSHDQGEKKSSITGDPSSENKQDLEKKQEASEQLTGANKTNTKDTQLDRSLECAAVLPSGETAEVEAGKKTSLKEKKAPAETSKEKTETSKEKTRTGSCGDSQDRSERKKGRRSRSGSREKEKSRPKDQDSDRRRNRSRSNSGDRTRDRRYRRRSRSDSRDRYRSRDARGRSRSRERNRRRRSDSRDRDGRKRRRSRSTSQQRLRAHKDRSESVGSSNRRRRRSRSKSKNKDVKGKKERSRSDSRDKEKGKGKSSTTKNEKSEKQDLHADVAKVVRQEKETAEGEGRGSSSETTEFPLSEHKDKSRSTSAETTEFPVDDKANKNHHSTEDASEPSESPKLDTTEDFQQKGKLDGESWTDNLPEGNIRNKSASQEMEMASRQTDGNTDLENDGSASRGTKSETKNKEHEENIRQLKSPSVEKGNDSNQRSDEVKSISQKKDRSDSAEKESRSIKTNRSDSKEDRESRKKHKSYSVEEDQKSIRKDRSNSKEKESSSLRRERSDSRDTGRTSRRKDRGDSRDRESGSRHSDRVDKSVSSLKGKHESQEKEQSGSYSERMRSVEKEKSKLKDSRVDEKIPRREDRHAGSEEKSSVKRKEREKEKDSRKSKDQRDAPRTSGSLGRHPESFQDSDSDDSRDNRGRASSPGRRLQEHSRHSSREDSAERVFRRRRSRSRSFDRSLSRRTRREDVDSEEEMFRRHAKDWSRDQARRHYKRRHEMTGSSDEDDDHRKPSSKPSAKGHASPELSDMKKTTTSSSSGTPAVPFDLKDILLPGEAPELKSSSSSTKSNQNSKPEEAVSDRGSSDMEIDSDNEDGKIEFSQKDRMSAKSGDSDKKPGHTGEAAPKAKESEKEKKKPEKVSFSLKGKGKEMKLRLKPRKAAEELDDSLEEKGSKLFLPQESDREDEMPSALDSVVEKIRNKLESKDTEPEADEKHKSQRSDKLELQDEEPIIYSADTSQTMKTSSNEADATVTEENQIAENTKPVSEITEEEDKPRGGVFHFKSKPLWELDKDEDEDMTRKATVVQTGQKSSIPKSGFPISLGLDYGSSSEEESEGGMKKSPRKRTPRKGQRSPKPSRTGDEGGEKPHLKGKVDVSPSNAGYLEKEKLTSKVESERDDHGREKTVQKHFTKSDSREECVESRAELSEGEKSQQKQSFVDRESGRTKKKLSSKLDSGDSESNFQSSLPTPEETPFSKKSRQENKDRSQFDSSERLSSAESYPVVKDWVTSEKQSSDVSSSSGELHRDSNFQGRDKYSDRKRELKDVSPDYEEVTSKSKSRRHSSGLRESTSDSVHSKYDDSRDSKSRRHSSRSESIERERHLRDSHSPEEDTRRKHSRKSSSEKVSESSDYIQGSSEAYVSARRSASRDRETRESKDTRDKKQHKTAPAEQHEISTFSKGREEQMLTLSVPDSAQESGRYSPSALSPAGDDYRETRHLESGKEESTISRTSGDGHQKEDSVSSTTPNDPSGDQTAASEGSVKAAELGADSANHAQQESAASGSSATAASAKLTPKAADTVSAAKTEPHPHIAPNAMSPRAKTGRFGTAGWSSGGKRRERGLRPPIETIIAVKPKVSSSPGAASASPVPKPSPSLASPGGSSPVPHSPVPPPPTTAVMGSGNSSQPSPASSTGSPSKPGKIQIVLGRKVIPLQESPLAAVSEDTAPEAPAPEVTVGFPVMVLTGTRKAEEPEPSEMIWPECRAVAAKKDEEEEEESSEDDSSSEEEDSDASESERESSRRKDSRSSARDDKRDSRRRDSPESRRRDDRRRRDDSGSRTRRGDEGDRRRRTSEDERRKRRDEDDRRRRDEDADRRRREREREREKERERERERREREREREKERERQREIEREREEERRRRRRSRSRSQERSRERSPERRRGKERDPEGDRQRDQSPVRPDLNRERRSRSPDHLRARSPDRTRPRSPDRMRGRSPEPVRDRTPDRFRGQSPGRGRERSPDRFRGRSPDRFRGRSPDRLRERSPERLRARSPDRYRPRSPDRLRNRSPERFRVRSPDRLRDRSPDRFRARSPDHLRDRSPDHFRHRSPDRLRGRSPDLNRDRTPPLRGPRDSSPSLERSVRGEDFDRVRGRDASRERSPVESRSGDRLFDDSRQRYHERGRGLSPGHSPGRRRDDSIDRYRDMSRDRGQYSRGRSPSPSPSRDRDRDSKWLKAADSTPGMNRDLTKKNPAFIPQTQDVQGVPPPPPPDFFHPTVAAHPAHPSQDPAFAGQLPTAAGQAFGQFPEGYVDPQQAVWQAGGYPHQIDPATLQMLQHQYQAMGYPPDQALVFATQHLTAAAATPAQGMEVHPTPAMPDPSAFPVDQGHPMYMSGDPAFQGHAPPPVQSHPGYMHGHPPPGDYTHHPHVPFGPEAYPPGFVHPPEAQFPYERFAEMEAHLQAEMHPDPREAALFGDLPNSRRPKAMKRQRDILSCKDLPQQGEPAPDLAKDSLLAVPGKSEPALKTQTTSEPDFDFETSAWAEPEEGKTVSEIKTTPKTTPQPEDGSQQKEGEDVVSSTNSAEMADQTTKEESSELRPLKVKSRWRRNSEAEATSSTPPPPLSKRLLRETQEQAAQEAENSIEQGEETQEEASSVPPPPPRKRLRMEAESDQQEEKQETGDDFPKFEIITENIHLTERKKSKSMKRMVCDCTTSKADRAMGIPACGEDCLNRMLMIECGSRCPCFDYCSNKRFQKKQYAKTEPFNCGPGKGWGLRATEDMPNQGTFVMEYVGELLDYREFVRRSRQYAKQGMPHHYFMALNADELIDATLKGSNSRFLNHSCDPNCETQKWTVNGELRVGFFTKKPVTTGEELTFDYQFEFYGKPQKCYCGAEKCRGFIGGQKNMPVKKKKDKTVERRRVGLFEDEMLDEDMDSMARLKDGMKVKAHVLEVCRLMVRAEKAEHRLVILKIIQDTTEINCLRLFLGYHGLPLLWSWMVDIDKGGDVEEERTLKTEILGVLKKLPISNRTIVKESKIMAMVEKWANLPPPPALPEVEAEADSVSEPLPLPVPPDRPVVSILTLHKDSKDQKGGKKKVTFADEAASSDSDLSDSLKVSSSNGDGGGEAKVSTTDSAAASSTDDKGDGESCDKVCGDETAEDSKDQSEGVADSAEDKSAGSEIETDETVEDSETSGVDLKIDGPVTRHRASRRPVLTSAQSKTKKKGGRRRLSAEKDDKDADSTSQKEEGGEGDSAAETGVSEEARSSDPDTSGVSALDLVAEGETDTSQDTLMEFPQPPTDSASEPPDIGDNFGKPEQSEDLAMLSSESDSTDSDVAANVTGQPSGVSKEEGDESEMPTLTNEATYSEVSYDPEEMDEISSTAAELLSAWSELKELYKIPKKQRAEERRRTERELESVDFKEPETKEPDPYAKWKKKKVDKPKKKDLEEEELQRRSQLAMGPRMSKEERRQLFEAQVKAEDELNAERQRQQEVLFQQQQAAVALLFQQDPTFAALHSFAPDPNLLAQGQVFDPNLQPFTGVLTPEQQQAVLMATQAAGGDIALAAQQLMTQPGLFSQTQDQYQQMQGVYQGGGAGQMYQDPAALQQQQMALQQMTPEQQMALQQMTPEQQMALQQMTPEQQQMALQQLAPEQQQMALQQLALQQQQIGAPPPQVGPPPEDDDVPPPPSPPEPRDMLPLHWKTARDSEGRLYYYHTLSRVTQWDPPSWDNPFPEDMDFDQPEPDMDDDRGKMTTTAAADTSSEVAKKLKEQFRKQMSQHVVVYLNPYRRPDCKLGRILSTDDFKHLARRLTHHVMAKELKHCRHVEDLEVNENVKAKAKDYVRKYMSRCGPVFKKSSSPDDFM